MCGLFDMSAKVLRFAFEHALDAFALSKVVLTYAPDLCIKMKVSSGSEIRRTLVKLGFTFVFAVIVTTDRVNAKSWVPSLVRKPAIYIVERLSSF